MLRCIPPAIPGTNLERIKAYAGIVAQAVAELIRQGYTPISFGGDIVAPGLPTIQVAPNHRTAQAIERDYATYYKHDTLTGTPRRWGTLLNAPPGVRVIFIEREH